MATSKLAKFVLILYTCAAGILLIEILQFFTSPDHLGSLVAISAAFASWFELWAYFNIYSYMTVITIKTSFQLSFRVYARILFHFRPALREKVKERLKKNREAWKFKEEAKPSTLTCFFYFILLPLMMIVNGLIFLREEGTPFVEGALQRFVTVATTSLYTFTIDLMAFSVLFVLIWIMVSTFRFCRSRTVETPAAIEEGRPEEVSEVQGGIYSTVTKYIQAAIIDEKLVDLDEPVPKLVDVDEEALRLLAVESTPIELL